MEEFISSNNITGGEKEGPRGRKKKINRKKVRERMLGKEKQEKCIRGYLNLLNYSPAATIVLVINHRRKREVYRVTKSLTALLSLSLSLHADAVLTISSSEAG